MQNVLIFWKQLRRRASARLQLLEALALSGGCFRKLAKILAPRDNPSQWGNYNYRGVLPNIHMCPLSVELLLIDNCTSTSRNASTNLHVLAPLSVEPLLTDINTNTDSWDCKRCLQIFTCIKYSCAAIRSHPFFNWLDYSVHALLYRYENIPKCYGLLHGRSLQDMV